MCNDSINVKGRQSRPTLKVETGVILIVLLIYHWPILSLMDPVKSTFLVRRSEGRLYF